MFKQHEGSRPREENNEQPSYIGFLPRPKVLKLYTIIAIFSEARIRWNCSTSRIPQPSSRIVIPADFINSSASLRCNEERWYLTDSHFSCNSPVRSCPRSWYVRATTIERGKHKLSVLFICKIERLAMSSRVNLLNWCPRPTGTETSKTRTVKFSAISNPPALCANELTSCHMSVS